MPILGTMLENLVQLLNVILSPLCFDRLQDLRCSNRWTFAPVSPLGMKNAASSILLEAFKTAERVTFVPIDEY